MGAPLPFSRVRMRRVAKWSCLCLGGSRRRDLVFEAASEELLRSLQAGSVAAADVLSLHRMKTLLLQQDPGQLRLSLDEFAQRCAMPPGAYARFPAPPAPAAHSREPGGRCTRVPGPCCESVSRSARGPTGRRVSCRLAGHVG